MTSVEEIFIIEDLNNKNEAKLDDEFKSMIVEQNTPKINPKVQQKYVYKQIHYRKFLERHGAKLKEQQKCELCGGHYSYYNKAHHKKSVKHQKCLIEQNNKFKIEYILNQEYIKDQVSSVNEKD